MECVIRSTNARQIEGARWPIPLLAYIDQQSDRVMAFDWACSCVEDLLGHFGKDAMELREGVALARRQVLDGIEFHTTEQAARKLWLHCSAEGSSFTAVAQLLFALSRVGPSDERFLGACSTPIILLERLESEPGEAFERVIAHFLRYVEGGLTTRP